MSKQRFLCCAAILLVLVMGLVGGAVSAADHVILREDAPDKDKPPAAFRLIDGLAASGSAQFSVGELTAMRPMIPAAHIIVVDLRQESHGLLNGMAVSWYGPRNWANQGKSAAEAAADEAARLAELAAAEQAEVHHALKKDKINGLLTASRPQTVTVGTVLSEEDLVRAKGLDYARLPLTDHCRPSDADVDRIIAFFRTVPAGVWLHFHCEAGHGRTTTCLAMLDMMRNAKTQTLLEIIARQQAAGGIDLLADSDSEGWRTQLNRERAEFIRRFYDYCRDNQDDFRTSWTKWLGNQ